MVDSFRLHPLALGVLVGSTLLFPTRVMETLAFFDMSRFGFLFDGFVFEFAEWTSFRVGIGRDFVFFGLLSRREFGSAGRPFYAVSGSFERNLFVQYFLLVP